MAKPTMFWTGLMIVIANMLLASDLPKPLGNGPAQEGRAYIRYIFGDSNST